MDVTRRLAVFAAGLTYDGLPGELRQRAKMYVLDAVGIMLGGVAFHEANADHHLHRFIDALGPEGSASIVGFRRRTTPLMAAFANGNLSQTLDCQDSSLTGRIHTGSAVMPAVLAMGEALGASGRQVITAAIAGYEVASRVALAVQPAHWFAGFQATGTVGTIGSATTTGRYLDLDARTMATAIGMAGSIPPLSSGDTSFKGYTAKTVHGGQAAMVGIEAAYLARAGFTAPPIEGEPPRHHAFLYLMGDGKPDLEAAVTKLGEFWSSQDTAFKPYPIGLLIVGAVEIVLDLVAERPIRPDEVARIDVTTYLEAVHFTGRHTTVDTPEIECFLSIPFCVAVALMDGEMTWRQRLERRLRDPATHALAAKVHMAEDAEMTKRYPGEWPVRLDIHLGSGEVISRQLDRVKWSPSLPATWEQLAEKFLAMAEPVIGRDRAGRAIDEIARLDQAENLVPLLELVRLSDANR